MAKTVNCTILDEAWDINSGLEWGRAYGNAGHSDDGYYLFCMKFETPDFHGRSIKIQVGLSMQKLSSQNPTLRFALCTSADNHKRYYQAATGEVVEENQIVTGVQAFALTGDYATYSVELETKELQPNTTYYLFVWAGAAYSLTRLAGKEAHRVALIYATRGGARLKTATSEGALHAAVIKTASGWKRFVPIIFTPAGWKRQG